MKIIQTKNFLKKQAQFGGSLPGDPSLPPGVTNQMIDEQFGGEESTDYSTQSGEFETKVDWGKETTDLINAGYDVRGLPQQGVGDIIAYYTYDAEVFGEDVEIQNLRVSDIKILMGGQYQPLTVSVQCQTLRLYHALGKIEGGSPGQELVLLSSSKNTFAGLGKRAQVAQIDDDLLAANRTELLKMPD